MMRRRTYAALAVMLAFWGVMLAAGVACGPAAPVGQGGAPDNPVATAISPTAVAPTVVLPAGAGGAGGWDGTGLPPPPTRNQMQRRYPNLDSYFIRKIREYEAAVAAAEGARGAAGSGQPMPTPEVIDLFVTIDTHEYVDDVRHFLEENGALRIKCVKFSSDYVFPNGGQCAALVQISLLRGLAELPGVTRIEKIQVATPASELRLP